MINSDFKKCNLAYKNIMYCHINNTYNYVCTANRKEKSSYFLKSNLRPVSHVGEFLKIMKNLDIGRKMPL